MALNAVTLAEKLRPWRIAGITHLLPLAPDECDGESCLDTGADNTPQGAHTPPLPEHAPPAEAPAARTPQHTPSPQEQAVHAPSSPQPPVAPQAPPPAGQTLPVEAWPKPWRDALAKASPAPLLWTYSDLAVDLAGKGDKARSGFLRSVIGTLSLPKGSSVFWPPAVLDSSGAPVADPALFLAGVHLLAPKVIILLGASALASTALPVPLTMPYTQLIFQGRLCILLPEFDVLLQGHNAEYVCTYLRSAFFQIPTLFHSLQS